MINDADADLTPDELAELYWRATQSLRADPSLPEDDRDALLCSASSSARSRAWGDWRPIEPQ